MRLSLSTSVLATLVACSSLGADGSTTNYFGRKNYNVLWLLIDDCSSERYPETGNTALKDKLPGLGILKKDGAVYYENFYSPASVCAPSQVALFSGMWTGNIGGQYQFSFNPLQGKNNYLVVPPNEVQFLPELLRGQGYYAAGGGKLDYQVGDVMPTFYNQIIAGAYTDTNSYQAEVWGPATDYGKPFFGMLNMMDTHEIISCLTRETPIPITNPFTGQFADDTPFGQYGWSKGKSILFNTGPSGAPQGENVATTDVEEVDIVGYAGDFDETTLTYTNKGLPKWLPDDIGVKSVLAREYDLIRNMDRRVQYIAQDLKARGLYDDTLIVVFGDHGSGTFRAKYLLESQSIRPPCWIKYPKYFRLSRAVVKGADGYNVDKRLAGIVDLYPTTLSVLGIPPQSWHDGIALAGRYETKQDREFMFGIVARIGGFQEWKTLAAFNSDYHYIRSLVTEKAIVDYYEMTAEDNIALINQKIDAAEIYHHYAFFPAAPMFDRMRRLQRKNAYDDDFLQKFCYLTADDAVAPSEVFYDLRTDNVGIDNLIINYTFSVVTGTEMQSWGNNVTKVTVNYSDVFESGLTADQAAGLNNARSAMDRWIETLAWTTPTYDFSQNGFAEENNMALHFWPTGTQPETADIETTSIQANRFTKKATAILNGPTNGTVIRYSVADPPTRAKCELIPQSAKNATPEFTPTNPGVPLTTGYISPRTGTSYNGYLYGRDYGLNVFYETFTGGTPTCNVFVEQSGTFMELWCPDIACTPFDTRDATWNGVTWVGVDPVTGAWLVTPVTFWDAVNKAFRTNAFNEYVFGPKRNQIYSGKNPDGSAFKGLPSEAPANKGFNPAPFYWAMPTEDVTQYPALTFPNEPWVTYGWRMDLTGTSFQPVATPGLDLKGSFAYTRKSRLLVPSNFVSEEFTFNSFYFDCLLWEVGKSALMDFKKNDTLSVFTQGVRKGYADSAIKEDVYHASLIF